ncbi:hypothetical protein HK097_000811 [Rhizophlyctis rosea]|uniref:Uncharacterized protein n=1 Tax=Rhizophlyctis rosea TaxID=64517 RepID=A0AAD5S6W8_9FUNG|nr:hypothetical protein HK097_000811 [Rhizophlyctis rosea]
MSLLNCYDGKLSMADAIACSFHEFAFSNSVISAIFATYLFLYFRGNTVWKWLFFNCLMAFIAYQLNAIAQAAPFDRGYFKKACAPLSMLFWSLAEFGDVLLFFIRYKIVKSSPMERSFLMYFFGVFTCAVITRIVDLGFVVKWGEMHTLKQEGVWVIEPIYFTFVFMCEVVLQARYVASVLAMKNVSRSHLMWTLLRSSGARFCFVTIPLFARIIEQFRTPNVGDPRMQWIWTFSAAVNLFTMFDLLMLKYELAVGDKKPVLANKSPNARSTLDLIGSFERTVESVGKHGGWGKQLWERFPFFSIGFASDGSRFGEKWVAADGGDAGIDAWNTFFFY